LISILFIVSNPYSNNQTLFAGVLPNLPVGLRGGAACRVQSEPPRYM
jgi:hypothetical protein